MTKPPTKSEAIRQVLRENPGASAPEIRKTLLSRHKIKVAESLVYSVRSTEMSKGRTVEVVRALERAVDAPIAPPVAPAVKFDPELTKAMELIIDEFGTRLIRRYLEIRTK